MTPVDSLEAVPAIWLAGFIILWGACMLAPLFRKTGRVSSRLTDDQTAGNSSAPPKKDDNQ